MDVSHTPERAVRIRHLFDQVVDLDPDQRAAFLDQACRDDADLRHAVDALLQADLRAAEVLQKLDDPADNAPEDLAPDTDPLIGQTLSRYTIVEKLGGGGMGVVYQARDTKLDRLVALKFLPPHLSLDDEAKARFIHEAKAASALDHVNIGYIHEIGETEQGHLFIAMAFYAGETLKKKIERRPLPMKDALDYAMQMAQGLLKAHAAGITHRDIKPANVMVTHDGVVKIVDFGLAKVAAQTQLTKTGTTLGTVTYMSPEQAQGKEVDRRTDLWSLGVVLYEMISGQLPFPGDYESAVMYGIVNAEPEPLTGLRTGVPMALEQVVTKCLRKDRALRYQHADDLIADLRAIDRASLSRSWGLVSADRLAGTTASDVSREEPTQVRSLFRFSLGTLVPWVLAMVLGIGLLVSLTQESPAPPSLIECAGL